MKSEFPSFENVLPLNIDSIGGNVEDRNLYKERVRGNFYNEEPAYEEDVELFTEIRKNELEKSDLELEMISSCNLVINKMIEDLGLNSLDFPSDNIHIINSSYFKRKVGSSQSGVFMGSKMQILLNHEQAAKSPIEELENILHEMIHAKEYIQLKINNKGEHYSSRQGLTISLRGNSSEKNNLKLMLLNEAVVSEIVKRLFFKAAEKISFFSNTLIEDSAIEKYLKELQSIDDDGRINKEDVTHFNKNEGSFIVTQFGYVKARKFLEYLVNEIFSEVNREYATKEDIYKVFFRAHFDGNLEQLFTLLKKTFGDDSYDVINDLTYNKEQISEAQEKLSSMRIIKKQLKDQ